MKDSVEQWGIEKLHESFVRRDLSPVEYAKHMLHALNGEDLNAIVTIDEEAALNQAQASERRYVLREPTGPLDGVLLGIKDIIRTKGIRTTFGCEAYDNYVPDEDAFVVSRLKAAGANISVKTNTSQFAMGPMGDVSYKGAVRNPRDRRRITGGSSSGSGAAVAGFLCAGALGTDSGGSIRLPSALCGVVGLKPTFSLVSNEGVMPVNESVDTVGPMTRSVKDNALLLNAIAGYNPLDWRSAPKPSVNYLERINEPIAGAKIAFAANTVEGAVEASIKRVMRQTVKAFADLGATVRDVPLPDMERFRRAHQLLLMAGAHMEHARDIEAHREHIYEQVYNRLMTGELHSDQYVRYERMKHEMIRLMHELLGDCDIWLLPTTPAAASLIGEAAVEIDGLTHNPLTLYPAFSWIASYCGFPCISVPAGTDENDMPIGVSLIARPFDEANLYRYAAQLERYMK